MQKNEGTFPRGQGRLRGSVPKPLSLAQVMIPESWDRAPHRAPCSAGSLAGSLLLPLPAAPPVVLSLPLTNNK